MVLMRLRSAIEGDSSVRREGRGLPPSRGGAPPLPRRHQRTFRGVAHHAVDRFTGRARRRLHLQARIACKHSRLQEEAHRGVIPQPRRDARPSVLRRGAASLPR